MRFLTNKKVHRNITYWDINAAGPTLLKHLYNIDLMYLDKQERNIRFGELQKENSSLKIVPEVLRRYTKTLAEVTHSIGYTLDSVLSHDDVRSYPFVRDSIFTFKSECEFQLLIIDSTFKNYIAFTKTNDVVIKGIVKNYLPAAIVKKFFDVGIFDLRKYKLWFRNCNYTNFLIGNTIVIDGKRIELKSTNITIEPDREFYWKKILPFIFTTRQEVIL